MVFRILLFFYLITTLCFCIVDKDTLKKLRLKDSKDTQYFWILSDVHIDEAYLEGGEPFCVSHHCCSEILEHGVIKAGKYGYPKSIYCDIPKTTYQETLDFISKTTKEMNSDKYIEGTIEGLFFLGDWLSHSIGTEEESKNTISNAVVSLEEKIGKLKNKKGENLKIFNTLGNHDSIPFNIMEQESDWLKFIEKTWRPFLSFWGSERLDVKKRGMYSKDADKLKEGGLRVIVLNTFWVDIYNTYNQKKYDPKRITNYFEEQLKKAREEKKKVIVIGHVPIGLWGPLIGLPADEIEDININQSENGQFEVSQRVYHQWNVDIQRIASEYKDEIVIFLFGHEHLRKFSVIKDKKKEPVAVSVVAPSLTTFPLSNPAIQLLKYNSATGKVEDIIGFFNHVEKSNKEHSMESQWEVEFSFVDDFGVKDISPKEMQDLITRLKNNKELYEKWDIHRFHSYSEFPLCEGKCKTKMLCVMDNILWEDYNKCINPIHCSTNCSGHGICVDNEICKCDKGYEGTSDCSPVCHSKCSNHGECIAPETCKCDDGYFGQSDCEPFCSTNCSSHGICISPEICQCDVGYYGLDDCFPLCQTNCSFHGVCIAPDTCKCDEGYSGTDDCRPICKSLCSKHGKCISPETCRCDKGYEGTSDCFPVCSTNCSSHGSCISPETCKCDKGYEGISDCSPVCHSQCSNHGECIAPETCKCDAGYFGKSDCEPFCSTNCSNHGSCKKPEVCECDKGYYGTGTFNCTLIPICSTNCSNHGICVDTEKCHCFEGYIGSGTNDCTKPQSSFDWVIFWEFTSPIVFILICFVILLIICIFIIYCCFKIKGRSKYQSINIDRNNSGFDNLRRIW